MGCALEAFKVGPHSSISGRLHVTPHRDRHTQKIRPAQNGLSQRDSGENQTEARGGFGSD